MVWPFRLLDWADPRIEKQMASDLAAILPAVNLTDPKGSAYFLKNLVSLALARGQDKVWRPKLLAALESVANHATVGTHHFGEVMVPRPGAKGQIADQRVATPHVWEGTLFCLTAMALQAPIKLQLDQQLYAPAPPQVLAKPAESTGCQALPSSLGWRDGLSVLAWPLGARGAAAGLGLPSHLAGPPGRLATAALARAAAAGVAAV